MHAVHAKMTKEEAEAAEAAAAEEAPHALKALVAGGERAAMVPIKRGDVVVASDRVVYGSGPNNSPNWRWVVLRALVPVCSFLLLLGAIATCYYAMTDNC